jgi:hypothetical protein
LLEYEVDEIVLVKLFLLLVVFVEVGAEVDFKGVVVEYLDEEQEDGECSEEAPNVGEDVVQLIVLSSYIDGIGRFVYEEGAVVGVVRTDFKPVLYRRTTHYASRLSGVV